MQLAYKRDLNHNYVYVEGGQGEDYQSRMVMENKIEGLLSCSSECLDGKRIFRYEITSMQSLWALYEDKKYDHAELESYYLQALDTAERLRQYLLDPAALVLNPKLIYLDGQSGKLFFCFLPGHSEEVTQGLQKLSEYFLPKIDHADEKAVTLGYGIYHVLMEDGVPLEQLRREILGGTKNEPDAAISQSADAVAAEKQMDEKKDPNTASDTSFSWSGEKREKKKSAWDGEKRKKEKSAWDSEKRKKEKSAWDGKKQKKEKSVWDGEKQEKKKSARDGESGANLRIVLGGGAVFVALLLLGRSALADKYGMPVIIGGILVITGIAGALGYALQLRKKDREEMQTSQVRAKHTSKDYTSKDYASKDYTLKDCTSKDYAPKEYLPEERVDEAWQAKEKTPRSPAAEDEFTTVLKREQESGSPILYPVNADDLSPIRIDRRVLLLGKRKEMSDAVIPRPTVSRIHAKIRCEDGRWYLGDLNSKNGTYVNGRLLKADEMCCLGEGDEVAFADVRYQFNADIPV